MLDNSIEKLLQTVKDLILHIEAYQKCLRYQVIYKPRQVLDDALQHGFPEDIYQHYINVYHNRNVDDAEQIIREIDNGLIDYLVRVVQHLRAAIEDTDISSVPEKSTTESMPNPQSMPDSFSTIPHHNLDVQQAIGKNNADLEAMLGIKRGVEMTVAEADKQHANPLYWNDERYTINCATCAAAFMLRLRGFDVKARGIVAGSDNEWLSDGHSFDIWSNADGSKPQPNYMVDWMQSKGLSYMFPSDYRQFFDETCKEEGIYIITLTWKSGGGHATILQRDRHGNLYYIEPQVYEGDSMDGRKSIDDLICDLSPIPYENKAVMRVDDKIFDVKYGSLFYT